MTSSTAHLDLDELRRPIAGWLGLAGLFGSWAWLAAACTVDQQPPPVDGLLPPTALLLGSIASLAAWRLARPEARGYLFLGGLAATFLVGYRTSQAPDWLYFQAITVVVSSLLVGVKPSLLLALLITSLQLWLRPAGTDPRALAAPLTLVWMCALASWMSTRNLYTALEWAMQSQSRAWHTAREVTHRREQLRRTLDSLRNAHTMLSRTLDELEQARREAEEARAAKSRFVANISHELRTPLNIIVGFAEMICTAPEAYSLEAASTELREDLLKVWRNAEHLLGMIDDVLDLSQIEASRLPVVPQPTDPLRLIRDTLVAASVLIRESGAELRVALPSTAPTLELDATRIRQVLLNLINNATRYAPGGVIEVGARVTDTEFITYVKDSGPGIPSHRLEAIFNEFERLDASAHQPQKGVGLGLTISRHFVRLHGGRVWAESTLGQGSTFYFSLPLPNQPRTVQPASPRRFAGSTTRDRQEAGDIVLVCEDQVAVRLLERHLDGMRVLPAGSVSQAIELVEEVHPEAVVLAASTPDAVPQALDWARELTRASFGADVPVVVSTIPTERRAGASLGVAELLIKPITQGELVSAISRIRPHPRRVLLVEDEADMLDLLERIITRRWPEAEVTGVTSAEKALAWLDQAQEAPPDLILVDLLMPGMGGVAFIKRLRALAPHAETPVIVITARGPAEAVEASSPGEIHVVRGSSLAAGEIVRFLELLTKALPPRYAGPATERKGTPEDVPA